MKCKKLISGIVAIMLVAVLAFGSTAAAVGAQADNGADLALASQNVSELTATTDSSASSRADSLDDINEAISVIKVILGAFSSSDKLTDRRWCRNYFKITRNIAILTKYERSPYF